VPTLELRRRFQHIKKLFQVLDKFGVGVENIEIKLPPLFKSKNNATMFVLVTSPCGSVKTLERLERF
jgi:hypothetical protein